MPIDNRREAPTILIKRSAWERSGVVRADIDRRFNLTPEEFRVEGAVVAIGPLFGEGHLEQMVTLLEDAGLVYYEEFFELSGNWPDWLSVLVQGA
jgi:hypothetical protein